METGVGPQCWAWADLVFSRVVLVASGGLLQSMVMCRCSRLVARPCPLVLVIHRDWTGLSLDLGKVTSGRAVALPVTCSTCR